VQNAVLSSHKTWLAGTEIHVPWQSMPAGTSHKTSSARCSGAAHPSPTDMILHEWRTGSNRVLPGGER